MLNSGEISRLAVLGDRPVVLLEDCGEISVAVASGIFGKREPELHTDRHPPGNTRGSHQIGAGGVVFMEVIG